MLLALLTLALPAPADTGATDTGARDTGAPDAADYDCPTDGTELTWENFGEEFFADMCASCHNPKYPAEGVDPSLVFDSEAVAWEWRDVILDRMGFADQFAIPELPPESPEMYQDINLREDTLERYTRITALNEWLVCGAPSWEADAAEE